MKKRGYRRDDDEDEEEEEEDDNDGDDNDEGKGEDEGKDGNVNPEGAVEAREDDSVVAGNNAISFVGMNFCGADPLTNECVLTAWRTAEEAYEHGLQEHCKRGSDGMYRCGWFTCEGFQTIHRGFIEKHYQRHLLGKWRCSCSELHLEKRHAVGCVHMSQLVELTAQYSCCEIEGCETRGEKKMGPAEFRDHVTLHLESRKDLPQFTCIWKGCAKKFPSYANFHRHMLTVHLRLAWRCLSCGSGMHKSQKDALSCCNRAMVPQPVLWTLGTKCGWSDCGSAFKAGAGEELRLHLKGHLDGDLGTGFVCKWVGGKKCDVTFGNKTQLVRHVEQVHGKLRLKCGVCGKMRALNKKKEIVNCDHEVVVSKRKMK